jgi:hypothetical protein
MRKPETGDKTWTGWEIRTRALRNRRAAGDRTSCTPPGCGGKLRLRSTGFVRLRRTSPVATTLDPFGVRRRACMRSRMELRAPVQGLDFRAGLGTQGVAFFPGRCPGLGYCALSGLGCCSGIEVVGVARSPGRCPGLVSFALSGLGCCSGIEVVGVAVNPGRCPGLGYFALSGLGCCSGIEVMGVARSPGRCPGLVYCAPLGLRWCRAGCADADRDVDSLMPKG